LASILNEVEGYTSAGGLRWLWKRGVAEQRPCACGEVPEQCPVWSKVIAESLTSQDALQWQRSLQEIIQSQHEVASLRNRLHVLRSATSQPKWEALRHVRAVTGSACQALANVTDAHVLIDTPKRPQDAAVVSGLESVEHFVLRVIRDPRAVAFSWRRANTFSVGGATRRMATMSLPSTVRRWIVNCLGAELLRRQLPAYRCLQRRYEDFSRDPRKAIDEILALLGEDSRTPFRSADTVVLHPNHIVARQPEPLSSGFGRDQAGRGVARAHEPTRPTPRRTGDQTADAAVWVCQSLVKALSSPRMGTRRTLASAAVDR
jgi:hypothetical protein